METPSDPSVPPVTPPVLPTVAPRAGSFIRFVRIFLLVLIIIGIALLCTIHFWVPALVEVIMGPSNVAAPITTTPSSVASDGDFLFPDPEHTSSSEVFIASSTPADLKYVIETSDEKSGSGAPSTGYISGVAKRDASTSTVTYIDTSTNDGCAISITYTDADHLSYVSASTDPNQNGCSSYYGVGAFFADHEMHSKNASFELGKLNQIFSEKI